MIKENTFSKVTVIISAVFLCCQALANMLGLIFLDTGFIGIPFLASKHVVILDFDLAGIIISESIRCDAKFIWKRSAKLKKAEGEWL